MKTKRIDIVLVLFSVLALTGLAGCGEMYHESFFTPNRIQMEKSRFADQRPVSEVSESFLDGVARDYVKKGQGPLDLVVTYDPRSRTNTAMKASGTASNLAAVLRRYGVDKMDVSIMPVEEQGHAPELFVSYDAYDAKPPKDCGTMSGMETRTVENDPAYKLGCTMDTIIAKQVARPKDLIGQSGEDPDTDGRRSARIVEIYRAGSKDQKLEGESASGL